MPRAPALIPTQHAAATTLEGVLERVTYANDDNAWSVVKLVVAGKTDLVTAVGNLPGVQPGESLRLSGGWATDKKYGEQFRVESYVTVKLVTLVGIERYLGSGLVRGVGKVMAERLVGHFDMTTLEVIDQGALPPDRGRGDRPGAQRADQQAVGRAAAEQGRHGVPPVARRVDRERDPSGGGAQRRSPRYGENNKATRHRVRWPFARRTKEVEPTRLGLGSRRVLFPPSAGGPLGEVLHVVHLEEALGTQPAVQPV
jgi:hypothetical protein